MTATQVFTPEQTRKAVDAISNNRPVYAPLLDFYGKIFIAREETKNALQLEPTIIPDQILSVKQNEHLPLINLPDFTVEPVAAFNLFNRICRVALDANREMADAARTVIDAVKEGQLVPQSLFTGLLEEDDTLDASAEKIGADKHILAFITYNSIHPFVTLSAEQLSTYLQAGIPWEQPYCPVCGSPAAISTLEDDGQRHLHCSFCWHKWSAPRLFCPFCSNADSETLHYFYSDEEKEYRVDVCDGCRKYIKTVDTRIANRPIYPPLEQISTLHLDFKAGEMGLESGAPLFLEPSL